MGGGQSVDGCVECVKNVIWAARDLRGALGSVLGALGCPDPVSPLVS